MRDNYWTDKSTLVDKIYRLHQLRLAQSETSEQTYGKPHLKVVINPDPETINDDQKKAA